MLEDPVLGLCYFYPWDLEGKISGVGEGQAVLLREVL